MLKDLVRVTDRGLLRLHNALGNILEERQWESEKSVIEVEGWVEIVARERGKIVPGSSRSGHNVWTTVGKEYLAVLMQIDRGIGTNRSDRMAYIGAGIGAQPEEPSVTNLVQPTPYLAGMFLAPLDPPTYPLNPAKTSVRYHYQYSELELTLAPGRLDLSEFGLFTNGGQNDPSTARDRSSGNASKQSPMAYKALEPIGKTQYLSLDVIWEIRF